MRSMTKNTEFEQECEFFSSLKEEEGCPKMSITFADEVCGRDRTNNILTISQPTDFLT